MRHRLRGLRSIAQEAGQYLNGVRCNQLKTASGPVMVQGQRARARLNKHFHSPVPDRGRLVASKYHVPKEAQNPSDGKQHISHPPDNCLGLNVTSQPDGADPTGRTVQPLCHFMSSLVPGMGNWQGTAGRDCPSGVQLEAATTNKQPFTNFTLPTVLGRKGPGSEPGSPNRCFPAPCGRCGSAGQVRCASGCNSILLPVPVSTITDHDHAPHRSVPEEGAAGKRTD